MESVGSLEFIDLVNLAIFAIALLMAYVGGRRGLLLSLYDVLFDALTLFIAYEGYSQTGEFLASQFRLSPKVANGYGFLLIVSATEIVWLQIRLLYTQARFSAFASHASNEVVNNIGGGILGAGRTVLVVICLLVAIYAFPEGTPLRESVANAAGTDLVLNATSHLSPNIDSPIDTRPAATAEVSPTSVPIGGEALPTTAGSPGRPDIVSENQLIAMTNLARRQAGLSPFIVDPVLGALSRVHTTEMARLALLFHDSPTSGSITDRLRSANIPFRVSAENVAFSRSLEGAFSGLLQSPEHRRNIMSTDLHRLGVSVSRTDPFGILLTQDFTD